VSRKSEYRIQNAECRSQKPEARRQKTEDRSQKPEARSQKTEDRRQKTEDRRQKTEVRSQKAQGPEAEARLPYSVFCILYSGYWLLTSGFPQVIPPWLAVSAGLGIPVTPSFPPAPFRARREGTMQFVRQISRMSPRPVAGARQGFGPVSARYLQHNPS
jgi:hypothetical protein